MSSFASFGNEPQFRISWRRTGRGSHGRARPGAARAARRRREEGQRRRRIDGTAAFEQSARDATCSKWRASSPARSPRGPDPRHLRRKVDLRLADAGTTEVSVGYGRPMANRLPMRSPAPRRRPLFARGLYAHAPARHVWRSGESGAGSPRRRAGGGARRQRGSKHRRRWPRGLAQPRWAAVRPRLSMCR